jgi:hypothetical protein
MPTLPNYKHFDGRHWETGTVQNYFAYMGVKAPHTGQPYSEAMLMGVSGGVLMGYFSFAYKGYDPHVAILSRNTINPLDTLLVRLGVVQHLLQTTDAKKGLKNLLDVLEEGSPAIVWADVKDKSSKVRQHVTAQQFYCFQPIRPEGRPKAQVTHPGSGQRFQPGEQVFRAAHDSNRQHPVIH